MRNKFEDYLIKDAKPPQTITPIILSKPHLEKLASRYQAVTHRFPWEKIETIKRDKILISVDNGSLQIIINDTVFHKLIPVTKCKFRYLNEPLATSAFIFHDSELYFQGKVGSYKRINKTR